MNPWLNTRSWILIIIGSAGNGFFLAESAGICMDPPDFKAKCDTLGGVVVLYRCFFVPSGSATWENAFGTCTSPGATLAQVHTAEEYSAITSLATKASLTSSALWIALYRDSDNSVGSQSMVPDDTHWYSDSNSYDHELSATDTWILAHQTDSKSTAKDNYCFALKSGKIIDTNCAASNRPICQITNLRQTFEVITGKCLDVDMYTGGGSVTEQECINLCVTDPPCHSFQFHDSNCRLLSWQTADKTLVADSKCVHYKPVPP